MNALPTSRRSDSERRQVTIEAVSPEIDCGRFPIKRTIGERVMVEADVFVDGHDALSVVLLHRRRGESDWYEIAMRPMGNDRWRAAFAVDDLAGHEYTIEAWIDRFGSWLRDLHVKDEAGQGIGTDLQIGAELVAGATDRAEGEDRRRLRALSASLASGADPAERLRVGTGDELAGLMRRYPDRSSATRYGRRLSVTVDRERARFSAWYEMFPRSAGSPGRHGTLDDCRARLPYVAGMGFDVLYVPPIHPIGKTARKGKNNAPAAQPDDPGSPWAIGASEGGHKAVHPQLGTLDDFRRLVRSAHDHGMEIALDLAFQCSPDHPYVREHPEWFHHRPDGTIRHAENPPKRYEDIYPLNFETDEWRELWSELLDVVLFWIDQGVRIFRVDNPHTKPFSFWEWLIAEVKHREPTTLFLSEAFTRPKVMKRLAKLGFTQSYTYFAWRNTKGELESYFRELTATEVAEYFRPHLWPNTPDILTAPLQIGGRPAFVSRLVLAATLGAGYGIYGPAFELGEHRPREANSEEYLNSEKYELRSWEVDRADSLRELIARINRIRRDNPALQVDRGLRFHPIDNDEMIAYSKRTADRTNVILTVVNLDVHHTRSGWVELPLDELGIDGEHPYQVHDLLSDARFLWHGPRNYVELNPAVIPAHIFRLRRKLHSERDFDYYQ